MNTYSYGRQSIDKSDIKAVTKALTSSLLTQGPLVAEFEKQLADYTTAKYAVVVSNGTAALHLVMLALGLSSKDVGITSPITFMASANCLQYVGSGVSFADIDPATALIDPQQIQAKITSKTKVIIPVHYAGQSADMKKIHSLAKAHHLYVVEDAAHAIGSKYLDAKVGSCKYSDATIFSFHPVKTITTAEGGAITTNNRDLYQKLIQLRNHGISRDQSSFQYSSGANAGPWYHEMQSLGFNYRLPDVLAALGISQLRKIDNYIAKRQKIVDAYRRALSSDDRFTLLKEESYSQAAFHLFPILLNIDRLNMTKTEIFFALAKKGIKLQVHYIPVHTQPYYRKLGFKPGDFPFAQDYYLRTFSLPLYPSLTQSDVRAIIKIIKKTIH